MSTHQDVAFGWRRHVRGIHLNAPQSMTVHLADGMGRSVEAPTSSALPAPADPSSRWEGGTGRSFAFDPTGVSVTAVDVAPRMVERASRRALTAPIAIDVRLADVQVAWRTSQVSCHPDSWM
jgi:hypothetical protein